MFRIRFLPRTEELSEHCHAHSHNLADICFAEDILKSGHAVWVSPDGGGLVYAAFDDSEVLTDYTYLPNIHYYTVYVLCLNLIYPEVEEVQFEVYDSGGGDGRDGLYPGVSSMRYPKERRETDLKYRVFVEVNHSTLYCTP